MANSHDVNAGRWQHESVHDSLVSARFDDLVGGTSWLFGRPDEVAVAWSTPDVREVLARVERRTSDGAWAWGYLSYEAAAAFDPALTTQPAEHAVPLVYFAIGAPPVRGDASDVRTHVQATPSALWQSDWSQEQHRDLVERVRAAIARGDVYQANLTTRLRSTASDDVPGLYARLAATQGGAYNAYLDCGDQVIISASPELFFRWDGRGLTTRPMKGTAARGETAQDDRARRAALLASPKERAENVMIVDLLRNDLARVAEVGSVRVRDLLAAERYDTVWQLTSTVSAVPRPDVRLVDIMAALFPSGSVTGAPKAAAMKLIAQLETAPRGVYCGAIGMVAPPGEEFRARFSVAIRTVTVNRRAATAVYGVGGGITWDSDPAEEYAELLAKAQVLHEPAQEFQLIETLRFEPGSGLRNADGHLRRMADSADYFGFDRATLAQAFGEQERLLSTAMQPVRVRLLLARDGTVTAEHEPLPPSASHPVVLAIDSEVTRTSRWTRHKTTRREHCLAAAARHPEADDVVLVSATHELLETTVANLAVCLEGHWCTPPLSSGCLPGVERARLVAEGTLHERRLSSADLSACEGIAVVNSLRGWRPARLHTAELSRTGGVHGT